MCLGSTVGNKGHPDFDVSDCGNVALGDVDERDKDVDDNNSSVDEVDNSDDDATVGSGGFSPGTPAVSGQATVAAESPAPRHSRTWRY